MSQPSRAFRVTRRRFLGTGAAGFFCQAHAFSQSPPDPAEAGLSTEERKEVAAIRDKARMAEIGPLKLNPGEHFLVVGDASDDFQNEVLGFCEKLGKAFLTYYIRKGFKVDYPEGRMTLVILKDRKSYGAWNGEPADDAIGGHYDRDSNRLVVFDFRNESQELGDQARVVNSFTLSHEANHLLGFNTGLLSRSADVPTCVIEGLATVGELFQKTGNSAIGGYNRPRITALADAARAGEPWIDVPTLLADDELCNDPKTYQRAYAESWLLITMMIKNPEKLARLRAYLDRLKKPAGKADRIKVAEAALGSLDSLNRELKIYAKPYLRR